MSEDSAACAALQLTLIAWGNGVQDSRQWCRLWMLVVSG